MEKFFIGFDDPLFSVIALIIVLLIITTIAHLLQKYKAYKEQKILKELTSKYDYQKSDDSMVQLIKKSLLPKDTILFSAKIFEKNGDYESAIKIYVQLLKIYTSRHDKEPIMEGLGFCYLKSGFYQRAINMYKEILQINHSNIKALNQLLIAYEKIKMYKKALEVLEPLNELSVSTTKIKLYLEASMLISEEKKSLKNAHLLLEKLHLEPQLNRLVASYLLRHHLDVFWENLERFDLHGVIDLLYYLDEEQIDFDKALSHAVFRDVLRGRFLDKTEGEIEVFEFKILYHLKKNNLEFASMSFEYICTHCKSIMPIYANRCPHCQEILSLEPKPTLAHYQTFKEISF